jgi:PilZ domain
MEEPETEEKRKGDRFPFIEDVVVDGSRRCTSSDISEGGLYISAIQAFEENSVIDVTIPFMGEKMLFKAEVKHCQPGIGLGIMFIDVTAEQKEKINRLIETLGKRPV